METYQWKYLSGEIDMISKLQSERIVQYINTMVENDNLHIQMEFCSDNLKNILENKNFAFNRDEKDQMTELEYFISCKIFIELLEALNYLHTLNPPIIHRDIKPANVLFTDRGINTGIFFKLCDFGISTFYEGTSITRGVGTHRYIAPEVWTGHYNTKADVYSLSIVAQQLFDLNNNSNRSDQLKEYFDIIEELVEEMSKVNYKKRPICKDIIDEKEKMVFIKYIL